MYYNLKILLTFITLTLFCVACTPFNNYEQKHFLKNNEWKLNDVKHFSFNIKDTSVKYNFSFLMQHGEAYPYSNIWFQLITKFPSGKMDSSRIEVPLSLPDGLWLGRRAGGLTEHCMNITPNAGTMSFTEKGNYQLTVIQDMRIDTLPDVNYIGMKLEGLK